MNNKKRTNVKKRRYKKKMILGLIIFISLSLIIGSFQILNTLPLENNIGGKLNTSLTKSNEITICNTPNDQNYIDLISDGFDGAIITWQDNRTGNWDIYAQKIDANGVIQWNDNGTVICNAKNTQQTPKITIDGFGGAIITWEDNRTGKWDIYAQRINPNGVLQWNDNGTVICNASNTQQWQELINDGENGAIITWQDQRKGTLDIYAQKIDANGIIQWGNNGMVICNATNTQRKPKITTDEQKGAIITWADIRIGNWDLFAQKIDANGVTQWGNNGTVICNATSFQSFPEIISDGENGAITTWYDNRKGGYDIYAQRIDANGITRWGNNGTVICSATNTQQKPKITTDGQKGAIITWADIRGDHWDIYAQKIDASGNLQWNNNGTLICNASYSQDVPHITSDDMNGAIISWKDARKTTEFDIYSQRINSSGSIQWNGNGTFICNFTGDQEGEQIINIGSGKVLIAWEDNRNGNLDILARIITYSTSTIDPNGNGGIPGFNPIIIGVISVVSSTIIATKIYKRKKKEAHIQ